MNRPVMTTDRVVHHRAGLFVHVPKSDYALGVCRRHRPEPCGQRPHEYKAFHRDSPVSPMGQNDGDTRAVKRLNVAGLADSVGDRPAVARSVARPTRRARRLCCFAVGLL